jgi:N-formylglutamate deformylase
MVPAEHYKKNKKVRSVMIEVRRDMYMDEVTGIKTKQFGETKKLIEKTLDDLRSFG